MKRQESWWIKNMKNIKGIIEDVIDLIKDNKSIFEKLNQQDDEVFMFEFSVNRLIEVLTGYKNEMIQEKETKKIFVSHYGNPYITAMLCIEAILQNCEITIGIEEICYGVNKAMIKIVNDVLKEYKMQKQILLKMNITKTDIEAMDVDEIICLGNSNTYTNLRKVKNRQVKYVPLFDIVLYYDSEKYEELARNIQYFATQNLYEIEIFDETEDFEDVIECINCDLPKHCATILSEEKQKQEKFKQEVDTKIVCVNENPFKKFELKIPKEIWNGDDLP